MEADLYIDQQSQTFETPNYKHQEVLYLRCVLKFKNKFINQNEISCLIYRRNNYISKAILNNDTFLRDEK